MNEMDDRQTDIVNDTIQIEENTIDINYQAFIYKRITLLIKKLFQLKV